MNLRNGFGAGMTMDFGNANAPPTLSQPQVTPQQQDGAYPTFTPGAEFAEAQFPVDLEDVTDLDTLLSSTEALNWKSIDQYLRLDDTMDYSWTSMLQGL